MVLPARHPLIRNFRIAEQGHGSDRLLGGIAARYKETTMRRWIRRVSIALASTAMAGGALVGAGGSASAAASEPLERTQSSIVTFGTDGGRNGYRDHRDDGYGIGHHGERDGRRDERRGSYTDGELRGHHHDRHHHHEREERRDGHHRYARHGDRWVKVTSRPGVGVGIGVGVGVDRWYLDQLLLVPR